MSEPIMQLRGVSKRFGSFAALSDVDLDLYLGEVHALLGVNGAGKSTLVKILSGVIDRDAGEITLAGNTLELGSPKAAIKAGIGVVQQHTELVPGLTAYENIFLGRERSGRSLLRRLDRSELRGRADSLLRRFPIDVDLDRRIGDMSPVEREIVAILQALSNEGMSVLLLDEPTSILTEGEKRALFRVIDSLCKSGIAVVYITHRLEEVFEIGHRLTVFRNGWRVSTLTVAEARQNDVSIPELMLGRQLGHVFPERALSARSPGPVVLSCAGLAAAGAYADVSLRCHQGEITGVFGLVGSGLDELSKTFYGVIAPTAGRLEIDGQEVRLDGPHAALARGVFLVPGDRRTEGLTASRNVVFNTTIANLGRASGFGGLFRKGRTQQEVRSLAEEVDLQPPDLRRPAGSFSGGNQQKIVITKGLYTQARIYIFAEPTIGVDIGARATIYALMRELSREAAVLIMSSDVDEVHGLSDQLYTLHRGRVVLEGNAAVLAREDVLAAGLAGETRDVA